MIVRENKIEKSAFNVGMNERKVREKMRECKTVRSAQDGTDG